jgi:hypothetical protein
VTARSPHIETGKVAIAALVRATEWSVGRAEYLENLMGLNIDTSRTPRDSHRLGVLVQAIYAADSSITSETHWVEWKRFLDFATPKGKVTASSETCSVALSPASAAICCRSSSPTAEVAMQSIPKPECRESTDATLGTSPKIYSL